MKPMLGTWIGNLTSFRFNLGFLQMWQGWRRGQKTRNYCDVLMTYGHWSKNWKSLIDEANMANASLLWSQAILAVWATSVHLFQMLYMAMKATVNQTSQFRNYLQQNIFFNWVLIFKLFRVPWAATFLSKI